MVNIANIGQDTSVSLKYDSVFSPILSFKDQRQVQEIDRATVSFIHETNTYVERIIKELAKNLLPEIEKNNFKAVAKIINKITFIPGLDKALRNLWQKGWVLGGNHAREDVAEMKANFAANLDGMAEFAITNAALQQQLQDLLAQRNAMSFDPIANAPSLTPEQVVGILQINNPSLYDQFNQTAQATNTPIESVAGQWFQQQVQIAQQASTLQAQIDELNAVRQTRIANAAAKKAQQAQKQATQQGQQNVQNAQNILDPQSQQQAYQKRLRKGLQQEMGYVSSPNSQQISSSTPQAYQDLAAQIRAQGTQQRLTTLNQSYALGSRLDQNTFGQVYVDQRNLDNATRFNEEQKAQLTAAVQQYMNQSATRRIPGPGGGSIYATQSKKREQMLIDILMNRVDPSTMSTATVEQQLKLLETELTQQNIRKATAATGLSSIDPTTLTAQQEIYYDRARAAQRLLDQFTGVASNKRVGLSAADARDLGITPPPGGRAIITIADLKKLRDDSFKPLAGLDQPLKITASQANTLGLTDLTVGKSPNALVEVPPDRVQQLRSDLYKLYKDYKKRNLYYATDPNAPTYVRTYSPLERVRRIANTEITAAYNIGRLNEYLKAGITHVTWEIDREAALMSAATTPAARRAKGLVCKYCEERSVRSKSLNPGVPIDQLIQRNSKTYGARFKVAGEWVIPAHPYCRCYWAPVKPETDTELELRLDQDRVTGGAPAKMGNLATSIRNWAIGTGSVGGLSLAVMYAIYGLGLNAQQAAMGVPPINRTQQAINDLIDQGQIAADTIDNLQQDPNLPLQPLTPIDITPLLNRTPLPQNIDTVLQGLATPLDQMAPELQQLQVVAPNMFSNSGAPQTLQDMLSNLRSLPDIEQNVFNTYPSGLNQTPNAQALATAQGVYDTAIADWLNSATYADSDQLLTNWAFDNYANLAQNMIGTTNALQDLRLLSQNGQYDIVSLTNQLDQLRSTTDPLLQQNLLNYIVTNYSVTTNRIQNTLLNTVNLTDTLNYVLDNTNSVRSTVRDSLLDYISSNPTSSLTQAYQDLLQLSPNTAQWVVENTTGIKEAYDIYQQLLSNTQAVIRATDNNVEIVESYRDNLLYMSKTISSAMGNATSLPGVNQLDIQTLLQDAVMARMNSMPKFDAAQFNRTMSTKKGQLTKITNLIQRSSNLTQTQLINIQSRINGVLADMQQYAGLFNSVDIDRMLQELEVIDDPALQQQGVAIVQTAIKQRSSLNGNVQRANELLYLIDGMLNDI